MSAIVLALLADLEVEERRGAHLAEEVHAREFKSFAALEALEVKRVAAFFLLFHCLLMGISQVAEEDFAFL